jgi:hypothetical protein
LVAAVDGVVSGVRPQRGDERVADKATEARREVHQALSPDEGENFFRRTRFHGGQESEAIQAGPAGIRDIRLDRSTRRTLVYSKVS